MIHGDMKLAQVLLKRPLVLQHSSSAADPRKPLPVAHVKVAGQCYHITFHIVQSHVADFGDSRFSLRHSMDTSNAGTSGFASDARASFEKNSVFF